MMEGAVAQVALDPANQTPVRLAPPHSAAQCGELDPQRSAAVCCGLDPQHSAAVCCGLVAIEATAGWLSSYQIVAYLRSQSGGTSWKQLSYLLQQRLTAS